MTTDPQQQLSNLIADMLKGKGKQNISVETQLATDRVAISLIDQGERVPVIPLDQNYRSVKQGPPILLSIPSLLKTTAGQPGPLAKMLDRALAELHWRVISNGAWLEA